MVLDKARREAGGLHKETPSNPVLAAARVAVPTADPNEVREVKQKLH